jgi:hypothetical protein
MDTANPALHAHPAHLAGCTALALAAALAGCGGGNAETAVPVELLFAPKAAAAVPPLTSVQLEGCVVDEYYIPRTGTSVRAVAGDGRLIGHTSSDKNGVFTLLVPALETVSVSVDKAGGDTLVVPTGRGDLSVGACLRDPHA